MNIRLKVKILEKFGTQADFGQALKVHESDVSRVVRGRRALGLSDQKKWAKALKCAPNEIFGR